MKREIVFYQNSRGKSEILEYLEKLHSSKSSKDNELASDISVLINKIQIMGNSEFDPSIKKLRKDIWEAKIKNIRLLFGKTNSGYVFLNYFIKKDRKTPEKEIKKAERRYKNFINSQAN